MKLQSLEVKNLFSIGEAKVDLEDRGLILVTGYSHDEKSANGAGKSSLCNKSIIWGLYGQTAGKDRADSVINTYTKGPSYAEINLRGADGNHYTIRRQRNPNKLMLRNGTIDLSRRKESDTQELINKILGRDWKTFIQTDFFGQGRKDSFLELAGGDQKRIIEEILPIDTLTEWEKRSKQATSELVVKISECKLRMDMLRTGITDFRKQHEETVAKSAIWECNKKVAAAAKRKEINGVYKRLDNLRSEQETLKAMLHLASLEYEEEKGNELLDLMNEYDRHRDLATHKLGELRESLAAIENNSRCPLCTQKISPSIRNTFPEYIRIHQNTYDEMSKKYEDASEKYGEWSNKRASIDSTRTNLEKITDQIGSVDVSKLHDEVDILEKETNPLQPIVDMIQRNIDKSEENIQKSEAYLNRLNKEVRWTKFWENAFSRDLKNLMFDQVCPFLEMKTNEYLRKLNNGQIQVSFSTMKTLGSGDVRNDFSATATSKTGGQRYSLFSGGEQQITNFALGMALSDLAASQTEGDSQTLILDEPFNFLSPENCENLVNFLTQNLSEHKSTILLVSNEDRLKNLVPNVIHVEKKNGVSYIQEIV